MRFLPRDPGHTYVKRVPRWVGFPTRGRARSGTNHPKHPPKRKGRKKKIHKKQKVILKSE
jgi:hypothetical protein